MSPGARTETGRFRTVADAATTVAILATCVVIVWSILARRPNPRSSDVRLPSEPQSLEGAHTRGNPRARIAIIEYSEFQCPYCGSFQREVWPAIDKTYVSSGQVLFAFRHFPLEQIHHLALTASEAAECAGRQGRFWEMHALLFAENGRLEKPDLYARATELGLNPGQFVKCLDGEATNRVREDIATGKKLLVSSTPTFFIGRLELDGRVRITGRIKGFQPLSEFQAAIDSALKTH